MLKFFYFVSPGLCFDNNEGSGGYKGLGSLKEYLAQNNISDNYWLKENQHPSYGSVQQQSIPNRIPKVLEHKIFYGDVWNRCSIRSTEYSSRSQRVGIIEAVDSHELPENFSKLFSDKRYYRGDSSLNQNSLVFFDSQSNLLANSKIPSDYSYQASVLKDNDYAYGQNQANQYLNNLGQRPVSLPAPYPRVLSVRKISATHQTQNVWRG